MANYLIHTCNQRFRYVKDYLIPSMINQGISKEDVQIYLDVNNDGCLESCMQAFMSVPKDGNTWHLQDDVIICHDFKERTEKDYQEDIVCGYCFVGDDKKRYIGSVSQRQMWYSFPCIQIPNKIARDCAKWFFNKAKRNPEDQVWIKMKKYDDSVFDVYLQDYHPDIKVLNLVPNLVDHIDYLIGGSVTNYMRPEKETRALYFEDIELIKDLENELKLKFVY